MADSREIQHTLACALKSTFIERLNVNSHFFGPVIYPMNNILIAKKVVADRQNQTLQKRKKQTLSLYLHFFVKGILVEIRNCYVITVSKVLITGNKDLTSLKMVL